MQNVERTGSWQPEPFLALTAGKPETVVGWTHGGLGLLECGPDIPMPSMWALYHLGSGHLVTFLMARDEEALRLSSEVAALCDWSFDGLNGWKNFAPHILDDLEELRARNERAMPKIDSPSDEAGARAILEARETGKWPP